MVEPNPVPPWEWRHRKSREWQAYWLALARVASACVTRSGTRIVGLNMSGSESASRCPNDTHKNGATRSIVRKNGEAHILACQRLSCTFVNSHNQTRQATEHGD